MIKIMIENNSLDTAMHLVDGLVKEGFTLLYGDVVFNAGSRIKLEENTLHIQQEGRTIASTMCVFENRCSKCEKKNKCINDISSRCDYQYYICLNADHGFIEITHESYLEEME